MTEANDAKVIIMHGFEKETVFELIRLIKSHVENPSDIAFSMSTPVNLDWKLKDIISDVREDHAYFMEMEQKKREGGQ